jgi:hypothetical protein
MNFGATPVTTAGVTGDGNAFLAMATRFGGDRPVKSAALRFAGAAAAGVARVLGLSGKHHSESREASEPKREVVRRRPLDASGLDRVMYLTSTLNSLPPSIYLISYVSSAQRQRTRTSHNRSGWFAHTNQGTNHEHAHMHRTNVCLY